MKKWILVILVFLTACSTPPQNTPPYILFVAPLEQHPIWLKTKQGFLDACEANGINCDWKGPEIIAPEIMREIMIEGILKNADGIITQGVVPKDVMNYASEEKIPVMVVDSDVKNAPRLGFLVKNFSEQATLILDDIFSHHPDGNINIAIQVAELKFDIAQDQIETFKKDLETRPGNNTIVAISESKSDSLTSRDAWTKVLSEHKNIDVLVSFAAESSVQALYVKNHLNYHPNTLIYGVDELSETLEAIDQGLIEGTIITSFYDYGFLAVEMLLEHIKNPSQNQENVDFVPIKLYKRSK